MRVKDWAQLIAAAAISSGIVTGLYFIYNLAAAR